MDPTEENEWTPEQIEALAKQLSKVEEISNGIIKEFCEVCLKHNAGGAFETKALIVAIERFYQFISRQFKGDFKIAKQTADIIESAINARDPVN